MTRRCMIPYPAERAGAVNSFRTETGNCCWQWTGHHGWSAQVPALHHCASHMLLRTHSVRGAQTDHWIDPARGFWHLNSCSTVYESELMGRSLAGVKNEAHLTTDSELPSHLDYR
jgi:hypothetical protein